MSKPFLSHTFGNLNSLINHNELDKLNSGPIYGKIHSMSGNRPLNDRLTQSDKDTKIKVDCETSTTLPKSLKMLISKDLLNANLQNSYGLIPIPTNVKNNALNELRPGIDNPILEVDWKGSLQEVNSIVHGQIHPNLFLLYFKTSR